MLKEIQKHFRSDEVSSIDISCRFVGKDVLPSCFKVTELASNSIMVAADSLLKYIHSTQSDAPGIAPKSIEVNRRLASLWFDQSSYPVGWKLPAMWDAIAGNYLATDGWIRLHTNASHHRAAALSVLGCNECREDVASAVAEWAVTDLEAAIVAANGCAAEMRSLDAWQHHPQGKAVMQEPLVIWEQHGFAPKSRVTSSIERPLAGVKVLDLTRILAGPVATRFLAGYGANVLRIDPPDWDDSANAPEMSLGKRCATLDLNLMGDRKRFTQLLSEADVFVHGYRPGALDALGFGEQQCREINPGLISVSLCAYGWSGPWSGRRGFDSLVQMSAGIAESGMGWSFNKTPYPLPVQALDHGTGYLTAAAILHALGVKAQSGRILSAQLSLAKTADFLSSYKTDSNHAIFRECSTDDLESTTESTSWGPAKRLKYPVTMKGCHPCWKIPAGNFGSVAADWR